jgi:methylenetetrahydrofolate reductase (NADPH)
MRMKLIRDIFAQRKSSDRPVISFEFFPPRTEEAEKTLLEKTIPALAKLKPDYCSVTYGAGGSTRDKTLMITDRIQREHNLLALHHLTCVNSTREQIGHILDQAWNLDVRNILALRGDPPGGVGEFHQTEGGFEFSKELVAYIHQKNSFSIGVAGFPEGHIACKEGKEADWRRLLEKINAGADFVVTQLFFDNNAFYEFHNYLVKAGVRIPVCPGIMPILNAAQIKKITQLCGAKWPPALLKRLESLGDNDEAVAELGIEYATHQCEELLKFGVPGIHFYSMNRSAPVRHIMKNLKLA